MQPLQGTGNVPVASIVNTDVPLPTVDVVINGVTTRINASDYRDDMQLAEGQEAPAAAAPAGVVVPPLPGATEPGNTIPATPPATPAADPAVVPLTERAIAQHGKKFFVVNKEGKKLDATGKLDENAGGFDTEDAARATLIPAAV